MITVSARLFGIPLATWHIKLNFDLPVFDYKFNASVLVIELTTGPRTAAVPSHSREILPTDEPVSHEAPPPEVSQAIADAQDPLDNVGP